MVEESNQNVFLIQIDASRIAEFDISEFEIARVDCICILCFSVSFYGESHIHIPLHDAFRETNLELRFKASRPYGVLFLLAGRADYFLLQLYAGTVELKVRNTLNAGYIIWEKVAY